LHSPVVHALDIILFLTGTAAIWLERLCRHIFGVGCRVPVHRQEAAKKNILQEKPARMTEAKENLAEQIIDPRDLVAYQQGSIVSRMLVYSKSGTITVFAFDAGEGLSEHTAPYDAVLQILDGKTLVTIAGKEYPMKVGDLIIMPATIPHAVQAVTRFKMMLMMIHA
jgi:quercetin dioxygenase-like cupin family protein